MDSTPGSVDTRDVVSVCRIGGVLNRKLLREMLGYFIDENERRIVNSRLALAAGNRQTLQNVAHALRGSAAMMGAGRLHDLAWAVEMDAGARDARELEGTLDALQLEFVAVVATLRGAHPEAWQHDVN